MLCGLAVGYFAQWLATSRGWRIFTATPLQAALLFALAVTLLALGLGLRSKMRSKESRVDSFAAVRLLAASRAGALLGAGCAGWALGLLLWVLPRLAQTDLGIWIPNVGLLLAGVVLSVIAFIVERMCKTPPSSDEAESAGVAEPGEPVAPPETA